jgi:hypothetical protein
MDIQHGPKVLQRFKVAHKPLVKVLFNFENMESHGEPNQPIFRQLITWTSPNERITLLEFFCWYWYKFRNPTIVKDGGLKILLHRH